MQIVTDVILLGHRSSLRCVTHLYFIRKSVESKMKVTLKFETFSLTWRLFVYLQLFINVWFMGSVNAHETAKTTQCFPDGDVTSFDDILTFEELLKLEEVLLHEETPWQFFPKEVGSQLCSESPKSHTCELYQYQWKAKLNPVSFSKSTAWREIFSTKILSQLRLGAKSLIPLKVNGIIAVGGDFILPSECDTDLKCKYAAIIFLTKKWKRNSYGEILFYDSHGEILTAIYPKYGRIVVFPCDLKHLVKPPSLGNQQHMKAIAVCFAAATLTNQQGDSTRKQQESPPPLILLHKLLSTDERPRLYNVSNYLVRKFITDDGKPIMVFDGVINQRELNILTHAVNYGSYNYAPPESDSADNVQWIMQFEVDDIVKTALWEDIKTVVAFVSGQKDCFPYDAGCNNIRHMDNTKIHNDLTYGQKTDSNDQTEYTFLLYLNPNWTEDFHGETIFFANEDSPNPEMIFAVRPKHGRICVFHGGIPHSARPPSFQFRGARYSFAVKMATTEEKARLKADDMEIRVLRDALDTVSDTEAQEIRQILEKYKRNELNSSELELVLRKYGL